MELTHIISLANTRVELRFQVMVRSLRAVGCDLPVMVIPYDASRFDLPAGCEWLESEDLFNFLSSSGARPVLRKYLCLTRECYQFVDSDVVFLRNPQEVLHPLTGFVTSCGNWRNPAHTLTEQLRGEWAAKTTLWQWQLFNSGQFACDRPLFTAEELQKELLEPTGRCTILGNPFHEQPGMNLLVCRAGVPISNVTLPPWRMESTWAGDYPGECEPYWRDEARKPFLIHWAGHGYTTHRPIDQYYLRHMTLDERRGWDKECAAVSKRKSKSRWSFGGLRARLGRCLRQGCAAWHEHD